MTFPKQRVQTRRLNIAISGAGVAGPTLAYWWLRCGHQPTLIERAPAGGYVIDFWGVGYQVAQRMGIEPALRNAGYQVQRLDSMGRDGGVRASMRMGALARLTNDRFTSLPRGDVAAILHGTVADRAETIFGDRAEHFIPFFAARSRLGIWVRDQAMRAMSLEPLVKMFAGRAMRDDFELPDYDI